jgi:DNA-binding winged helix-turn-helix (wHTH) protein
MEYYFQDYVFKSDQLTLLKQGQLVKLRVNEAKLLALLLSDPDSVFSKDDIFAEVWSGKVVTEQVIFQNVSRLRNIFDNHAIINHPKKGYQWNIALIPPLDEVKTNVDTSPVSQTHLNTNTHIHSVKKYSVVLLSLLLIFMVYFFNSSTEHSSYSDREASSLKLALVAVNQTTIDKKLAPIDRSIVYDMLKRESLSYQGILIKNVDEKFRYRQLQANLEFVLLDKLAEYQASGLLLIDFSSKYGKYALNFSVEAQGFSWRGELLGPNLDSVLKKLAQQLTYISSTQLIQQGSVASKSINAKLILLHQQYPKDLIILDNLINNYLQAGHANEVLLLIVRLKKLAEQQDNMTYRGRALLFEASVYLQQNYEEKARLSLALASNIFNKESSPEDQIALLNVAIYLAFIEHDYQKLQALNLDVIRLAKNIGDYGKQFSSTLYMSVLAQKFEKLTDKQKYLQQAKAIYEEAFFVPQAEIQLDFYNFVIAREEKNETQQIKILRKVLVISNQNKGINSFYKNEAQDILASLFMSKEQFDDALGIFNFEKELTAKEKYLLATIYQRWGKGTKAVEYGEQAYNDAIWSAELFISLDSALLLLELSANKVSNNAIHQDVYVKYIRENSLPFWREMNKERLIKTQFPALLNLAELDKE